MSERGDAYDHQRKGRGMRARRIRHMRFLGIVILTFSCCLVMAQKREGVMFDWSRPETIDPLADGVGNLLDIDLSVYEWRAREAYQRNDFRAAAQHDLFILLHDYDNVNAMLHLARCYGRMGEVRLAANSLIRAFNNGYRGFSRFKTDADFAPVRENQTFEDVIGNILGLEEKMGEVLHVKAEKLNRCLFRLPDGFDPEQKYPLVVGLHGRGGNAEGFIGLREHLNRCPFIFVAAEGAYRMDKSTGSRTDQYSWDTLSAEESLWKKADSLTVNSILQVVDTMSKRYDVGEVYLFGFSQGAGFAYLAGIKNPNIIDGIVCIGGGLPDTDKPYSYLTKENIQAGNALRVFIGHSPQDQAVNLERGLRAKQRLELAGYDVTFRGYTGGHAVSPALLNEILRWIMRD